MSEYSNLTECPCGYEFENTTGPIRARDGTLLSNDRVRHFYDDHTPKDFGLTPLGEGVRGAYASDVT